METKFCSKCNQDKSLQEFYIYKAKPRNWCKSCWLERGKNISQQHYLKNKEIYSKRNRAVDKKLKEYVRNSKENQKCIDCGRKYRYWMLDFDHRPNTEKLCELSHCFYLSTIEKVQAEIDKCDLVCTNCHRDRTYIRQHSELNLKRWYEND